MKNTAVISLARLLLRLALTLCALASSSLAQAQTPQTIGSWVNGPNLPYFPTHIHLLRNGTVMVWPGDGVSGDDPRAWDPVSGTISVLPRIGFDPFCSAHTFLPDGRLFVAGGHINNWVGLPESAIYNPANNSWTRQARMNLGRWYPTVTGMPNGDVLVVSGAVDTPNGTNPLPQVWQAATGTWRDLTTAQLSLPIYPYMFLAPNGSVFNAGPEVVTRSLDTAGTGAWRFVGDRTFKAMRDYGSAVMYAPGKILTVGGGDPPTNTAEVIDLNAANPAWRAVGSMSVARRSMNATMLPTGEVLATGGTRGPGFNNGSAGMPVLEAELWNPADGTWRTLAAGRVARIYHSTALLLPDARVLVAGGNGMTLTEIFSPPYLFAGPRPTISSAPASVGKGQSVFIGTPDTGINGVSWVALPSVTHTNNMHQGFFRSTAVTQTAGGITSAAPNTSTVPPGHYMVFLLKDGVPSTARIVQLLASAPGNPVPSIASLAPATTAAGGPDFSLTVNGANFVAASKVRWNGADRTTTFVSGTQLRASILAADIAFASTAQVSVVNPAPDGGTSGSLPFTVTAATANNPLPVLASISPTSAASGAAALTLTATGSNFVAASKVHWNGTVRATTFVSATQLSAAIPASDLQAAGAAQVTVVTPAPGGGTSASLTFTIGNVTPPSNPSPAVSSLAPASASAGGGGFTLTVNGSNFVNGAVVRWNGADRTTAFVSATRLTASIPAADTAAAGTAQVSVFNPTPGGGVSAAQPFTIAAGQNLTALGSVIAKITAPLGGGSRNLQIIRDGITPPVGSTDSSTQYDTYDGANAAADDWIGYQYSAPQTFNRVVFQEGRHFFDGGWFTSLTVQVRQGGNWVNVAGLTATPAYPGTNNGVTYETFSLQFTPTTGDAIRLYGTPGGSAAFISVAELKVFGQ